MATIHINDLRLHTIIGTNPQERDTPQEIIINLSFNFDAKKAAESDDLSDTIDYFALEKQVADFVKKAHFYLLEALADQILNIILKNHDVLSAKIRIDKPHALEFAKTIGVEMEKSR